MTETKNTFRILFYIKRNALLRNGSAPIMGRITINGERAQFSTRLSVDPQVWDPHSGRVLGRRAPAERINERLDRIRMRLEQCYESLLDHAQRLTPNAVKNLFFGREQHREQLLGFFRRHNEEFGRMVGINRSKATFYIINIGASATTSKVTSGLDTGAMIWSSESSTGSSSTASTATFREHAAAARTRSGST